MSLVYEIRGNAFDKDLFNLQFKLPNLHSPRITNKREIKGAYRINRVNESRQRENKCNE